MMNGSERDLNLESQSNKALDLSTVLLGQVVYLNTAIMHCPVNLAPSSGSLLSPDILPNVIFAEVIGLTECFNP
jgi:hypothetical protein